MNIEERTVLITGANRGLGRALAFAFAQTGAARVWAGARKSEDVEKLKNDAATMRTMLGLFATAVLQITDAPAGVPAVHDVGVTTVGS